MAPSRVLVVDDQPAQLHFVRCSLEDRWPGCVVDTALSTRQGLSLLGSGTYDLMLTDYSLRDGTGLQLARAARRLSPNMPVVMLTAMPDEVIERKAGSARNGIRLLLRKPVDLKQLLLHLEGLLSGEVGSPNYG